MKQLIGIFCGLLLTGCTTVEKIDVNIKDASESKQLDIICKARPIAVTVFDVMRAQVEIDDSVTSKVYQASGAIQTICNNKPKNIGEALVTATKLYNEILNSQSGVASAVAEALAKDKEK